MFDSDDSKKFWQDAIYFAVVFLAVFFITFIILYFLNLIPGTSEPIRNVNDFNSDFEEQDPRYDPPKNLTRTVPDKVEIPKIGVNSVIGKPNTQDVAVLDSFLTKGAVYYPGSGTLEEGNIFLFGHSTGFRIVQNQAYKTFNDLNKLTAGDEIELTANGRKYIYEVTSVILVDEDRALVDFSDDEKKLTISTCNTFGQKQERWVVEARPQ